MDITIEHIIVWGIVAFLAWKQSRILYRHERAIRRLAEGLYGKDFLQQPDWKQEIDDILNGKH